MTDVYFLGAGLVGGVFLATLFFMLQGATRARLYDKRNAAAAKDLAAMLDRDESFPVSEETVKLLNQGRFHEARERLKGR